MTKIKKTFLKFIKLLSTSKLVFSNPKRKKLIIFDDTSIHDFDNVLKNREYFVLKTRYENITEIFITSEIIIHIIKNLKFKLSIAYLIAVIKTTKAKVVLTTVDNCYRFHQISKLLGNDIIFIAIQNAARYEFSYNQLLYSKKINKLNPNKIFHIPNYYCFGDQEEQDCKKYNINVKNFFKCGSLRLSNYLNYLEKKKILIEENYYDLSIISEPLNSNLSLIFSRKDILIEMAKINKFVIKYCLSKNLNFLFITKRRSGKDQEEEMQYYRNYLSDNEFDYLNKNLMKVDKENYSSYQAIHSSNLVIGSVSTMLRDKLALKGKILSCNFSNLECYDFPIKGICFLKNPSYIEFEERVSLILKMKTKEYFSKIQNKKLINLKANKPTFDYLNSHLDQILK